MKTSACFVWFEVGPSSLVCQIQIYCIYIWLCIKSSWFCIIYSTLWSMYDLTSYLRGWHDYHKGWHKMTLLNCNSTLVNILRWRILGLLVIFWVLRFSLMMMTTIFLRQIMLLIYFLVSILLTVRPFLLPWNQMSNLLH